VVLTPGHLSVSDIVPDATDIPIFNGLVGMSALLASVNDEDPLVCLVSLNQDPVPALNGALSESVPNVTARNVTARNVTARNVMVLNVMAQTLVIQTCLVQIVATLNVTKVARSCPAARASKGLHCVVHYVVIHFGMVHYAGVVVHCAGVVVHCAVVVLHCVAVVLHCAAVVLHYAGVVLRRAMAVHCVAAVHK